MVTRSSLRFTLRVDQTSRTIFSVSEKKDGSLILRLKSQSKTSPILQGPGGSLAWLPMPVELKSQKYSIHASAQSKKNINYIHHTMEYADGHTLETEHVTRAIKANDNRFALLFCRRTPDLRLIPPEKAGVQEISLGSYDPDIFTPIYAVLATGVDCEFPSAALDDTNVIHRQFSKIMLVVLWTFVSLPSHRASMTGHYRTIKPDDPEAELDDGLDISQCIARFIEEREKLETQLRDFHLEERINFKWGSSLMIPMLRFFKDGSMGTEIALRYMSAMLERTADITISKIEK